MVLYEVYGDFNGFVEVCFVGDVDVDVNFFSWYFGVVGYYVVLDEFVGDCYEYVVGS